MISALSWIPKGACNPVSMTADPPSKEDLELLKTAILGTTADTDADADADAEAEVDDDDASMEVDDASESAAAAEVSHALAAAAALGDIKGSGLQDIADGLRELDMDNYDDEDEGVEIFGKSDTYYPSNELDPYLKKKDDAEDDEDDDDDEDVEDMTIKPTDSVIVCAKNEDEVSELEVWILEELDDGDLNMYVHHAIILPAFPLCTAWLDCNLKSGDKGNFIAVGSMETAIEIWDLDLLEEVQPFLVLGGLSKKKKKGKKTSVKYRKGSHRDSVLGLAWNKEFRSALASASADNTVKVWDMSTEKCVVTVDHHTDKVQAVDWNQHSPEILLSGSFDQSVLMTDVRSSKEPSSRWSVTADVESLLWDPHNEHSFVVSLDNGTVQGFDVRVATTDSNSGPKPSFTLHAHDKAVSSVSYNPSAPNFLATGSTDKMVKLWDLSNNQPSCVASRNPKAGAVFSISFSEENPFLLAIGGSKGRLEVWDTLTDPGVVRSFGKYGDQKRAAMPSSSRALNSGVSQ